MIWLSFYSWLSWIVSFFFAALSGPSVIALYKKIGWLDDPSQQTHAKVVHTYPVPRGGGLVVAMGIIVGLMLTWPWSHAITFVLVGALILLISGTLDDHYDINPYLRYILNFVAAGCVIIGGIGIDYVTNPIGTGVINLSLWEFAWQFGNQTLRLSLPADLLALIWIVWNMNAVNWAKGVDGQLPGFVSLAAIFIAILSWRFVGDVSQTTVALLALSVSGAYAGLLIWNWYPQKMMPGYAAGSLAGYFLAVLSILSGAKIATVLLLLAIPTVDGVFAITRRLAKGKSPFWGDRGHLHHRMLDAGWSKRKIATFYCLATLFFGLIALQLNSRAKLYAMMASIILFSALIIWFKRSISFSKPPDQDNG